MQDPIGKCCEYRCAAKAVARAFSLEGQLLGDEGLLNNMVANLDMTVKTYKRQGEVVCQALRSASALMLPGLRRISWILRKRLAQPPHVLRASDHLIKVVSNVKMDDDTAFIRFDIKDFYMSGTHAWLAEMCFSEVTDDTKGKPELKELLLAILRSQYITVPGQGDKSWRVTEGAGMGMSVAGDVADLAFYAAAERRLMLIASIRRQHDVKLYARFKDDGLIVLKRNRVSNFDLFSLFKEKASFFKLTCDSISSHEFNMLDVSFFKGSLYREAGHLDYKLYTKPTQIWRPLSVLSCHHPSVHLSWPQSQVKRICRRFSCAIEAKKEVSKFERKYKESNGVDVPRASYHRRPKQAFVKSWIILPFRGPWGWFRSSSLSCLSVPAGLGHLFQGVGIAWKNGNKHMIHKVRPK